MKPLESLAMRDACAQTLLEMYPEVDGLVVLDADVSKSTKTAEFAKLHQNRFLNVGIAEQNMVSMAAGLAAAGMVPVVNTCSMLLSTRSLDQLRQMVAYPCLNVKFMAHYGGYSCGAEGPTHHAIEDLGIIRSIPNMILLVPCDALEARQAIRAALKYQGPVYVRLSRNPVPGVHDTPPEYTIGKGYQISPGDDLAIIATGVMVARALDAAEALAKDGLNARVIAMPSIKPIDKELIIQAAIETGAIVTAEEHNIIGGLGSAVAEVLVENKPVPMERVGIQDCFSESAEFFELLDLYGMGVNDLNFAAKMVFKRKVVILSLT